MYNPNSPNKASEIARGAVVTVSIAALTIGIFSFKLGDKEILTSVFAGKTLESPGTSNTSSKVKASSLIIRIHTSPFWILSQKIKKINLKDRYNDPYMLQFT